MKGFRHHPVVPVTVKPLAIGKHGGDMGRRKAIVLLSGELVPLRLVPSVKVFVAFGCNSRRQSLQRNLQTYWSLGRATHLPIHTGENDPTRRPSSGRDCRGLGSVTRPCVPDAQGGHTGAFALRPGTRPCALCHVGRKSGRSSETGTT